MAEKISTYIRDDLRSKILSGANLPDKWTLPALARQFRKFHVPAGARQSS